MMHVYSNECDWVVAENLDDAWAAYAEHMDSTVDRVLSDFASDDPLEPLPDDKVLKLWLTADGKVAEIGDGTLTELAAGEWASRMGRGYLASTEY